MDNNICIWYSCLDREEEKKQTRISKVYILDLTNQNGRNNPVRPMMMTLWTTNELYQHKIRTTMVSSSYAHTIRKLFWIRCIGQTWRLKTRAIERPRDCVRHFGCCFYSSIRCETHLLNECFIRTNNIDVFCVLNAKCFKIEKYFNMFNKQYIENERYDSSVLHSPFLVQHYFFFPSLSLSLCISIQTTVPIAQHSEIVVRFDAFGILLNNRLAHRHKLSTLLMLFSESYRIQ